MLLVAVLLLVFSGIHSRICVDKARVCWELSASPICMGCALQQEQLPSPVLKKQPRKCFWLRTRLRDDKK